jgi:signal transduction protein with GAF and PtsI domain
MREKATEETWWLYMCSFMPGRAAEFTRQKQRRENMMISIIGKRCAKDLEIDLKLKDVQSSKKNIQSLSSEEIKIEAERRRIEENWREMCCEQEILRRFAEWRRQREQADWAQRSTQADSARKYGHFHGSNIWDF